MVRWRITTTVTMILRRKKIPFLENAPSWGRRWDTSPTSEGAGVVAMVKNTHDYQPQWVLRGVKLGNLPAAGVWRWWAGGGRSDGGGGGGLHPEWLGWKWWCCSVKRDDFGWCSLTRSCPVTFEMWLTDANAWCGRSKYRYGRRNTVWPDHTHEFVIMIIMGATFTLVCIWD